MKNLLIILLFIPLLSSAQKFEISEQAGYSCSKDVYQKNGFSNNLAFGYHPWKHFAVSAFYELNSWTTKNNSFGVTTDLVTKYFYLGVEVKEAYLGTINDNSHNLSIKYKPCLGYGFHVGARQKLSGHISLFEQVGYGVLPVKWTLIAAANEPAYPGGGGWCGFPYHSFPFSSSLEYYYSRIGLSYKL